MKEEVLQFGEYKELVGIITYPLDEKIEKHRPVFIFLNSGFIHRVGFSRVHVEIARELSRMGFVSLRMDSSGIGDSLTRNDNLEIDQRWVNETREAMNLLCEKKEFQQFVLVGNCSGAELSYKTACIDERVVGAVLINPTSNKIPLKYYLKLGLFMPSMWLRLLGGKLKFKETFQKFKKKKAYDEHINRDNEEDVRNKITENMTALTDRGCRLFIIQCEWDPNFYYFQRLYKKELRDLISREKIKIATIKGMNHDFFLVRGLKELSQFIQDWSQDLSDAHTD